MTKDKRIYVKLLIAWILCVLTAFDLSAGSKEYNRRKAEEAKAKAAEANAEAAKAKAETAKAKAEAERLRKEREKEKREKETDWDAKMLNAVAKGDVGKFLLAIANGANLNANLATWSGDTALHLAVRANEPVFIKILIDEYKMNVDVQNFRMLTPLQVAAMAGYTDILKLLIARKADLEHLSSGNQTAFQLAVHHGHVDTAKALREAGCTIPPKIENLARTPEMKEYVASLNKKSEKKTADKKKSSGKAETQKSGTEKQKKAEDPGKDDSGWN